MIYIIYITTNLLNDTIYIGVHEQNDPYKFDGYLGSGKHLKRAIQKYGKENFKRDTLLYYWDEYEAYTKESEIVTEEFVKQDWNYNMIVGGSIPPSHKGTGGITHHRYGLKESNETRIKKSISHTGIKRPDMSKIAIEMKFTPPNSFGKKWITNGIIDKYIMKTENIPFGWIAGRTKAQIRRRV